MKPLICSLFLNLFLVAFASSQTIYLNGRQYDKINGQWYQVEDGQNFQVNNSIITVKFKPSVTESQRNSFNQTQGVQEVRVNMLGFYDLQIPAQADPLTVVQNYLNSGLVEVAEPNTFGEYVGTPNDPRFPD